MSGCFPSTKPPSVEHAQQRQLRLERDAGVHPFPAPLVQQLRLPAAERILIAVLADHRVDHLDAALLGYQPSSIGKVTNRCLAALSRELLAADETTESRLTDRRDP